MPRGVSGVWAKILADGVANTGAVRQSEKGRKRENQCDRRGEVTRHEKKKINQSRPLLIAPVWESYFCSLTSRNKQTAVPPSFSSPTHHVLAHVFFVGSTSQPIHKGDASSICSLSFVWTYPISSWGFTLRPVYFKSRACKLGMTPHFLIFHPPLPCFHCIPPN